MSKTTDAASEQSKVGADGVRFGSGAMFDGIAERYDLLNRVISLGVDQSWRRRALASLRLGSTARVLDLATGTADLAIAIARLGDAVEVDGVDPSTKMLEVGRRKVAAAGLGSRVRLVEGIAEALPFEADTFDGATIAFGIRNVPDRPQGLAELRRVVKPGARVAVLELSEPEGGLFNALARVHVHHVVPTLGAWLSGEREYAYLQRSIAAFPPPQAFAGLMRDAGLEVEAVERLTFGAAHLYVGRKPGGA